MYIMDKIKGTDLDNLLEIYQKQNDKTMVQVLETTIQKLKEKQMEEKIEMDNDIKLFTYSDKQKLELAEEMMSQFGRRIASIEGRLRAYLEMDWCKINDDPVNVKINKTTLEDASKELSFLRDIYSHYTNQLLKK